MALDRSQTKAIPFLSQGLLAVQKSSKNTSQMQHVQRNRRNIPVTGPDWPRGFQEVKVPSFRDKGTGWW